MSSTMTSIDSRDYCPTDSQHLMPTALSSADFTDFSPPRYLAAQTIWNFSVLDPKRTVVAS